jgi:hypothetical protein
MFGRRKETSWAKVAAAVVALKVIPMRKALLGLAAVAGTVYAVRRMRSPERSMPSGD